MGYLAQHQLFDQVGRPRVTGPILHLTHLHLRVSQFFSSFALSRFDASGPIPRLSKKGTLSGSEFLVFGAVVMDQNQAARGLIAHLAAAPQVEEPGLLKLLPLA